MSATLVLNPDGSTKYVLLPVSVDTAVELLTNAGRKAVLREMVCSDPVGPAMVPLRPIELLDIPTLQQYLDKAGLLKGAVSPECDSEPRRPGPLSRIQDPRPSEASDERPATDGGISPKSHRDAGEEH